MPRKILGLNSPGDATHFAGDDYDILAQYHEDVDLSATYPSRVATNTEFRDNRLRILNPLRTKSIRLRTLNFTEDFNLTIPLMEADDDLVLLALIQEIYNKKISLSENDITDAAITLGDMIKSDGTKFVRFPVGLPGQIPTVNEAGLDWVWADPVASEGGGGGEFSGVPDDDSVSTIKIQDGAVTNAKLAGSIAGSQLLDATISTAKIADLAVTVGKLAGSITGSKLTNGTITSTQLADSAVTNAKLAGLISNDKLLQITDTTKLPTGIRYDWASVKPGAYTLTTSNGGEGIWNGVITSTGSYSNHSTTSTQYRARFATAATTNAQAGIRTTIPFTKPQHLQELTGKIFIDTTMAAFRFFVGLTSLTTAFPTPGQTIGTWMTGASGIGLLSDLPENPNWRHIENNGSGAATGGDISPAHSLAAGGNHTFKITHDETDPSFNIIFNGSSNVITVDIPPVNTAMGMLCYIETEENVAKEFELSYLHTVCDAR